jgi:hypothetical protein
VSIQFDILLKSFLVIIIEGDALVADLTQNNERNNSNMNENI